MASTDWIRTAKLHFGIPPIVFKEPHAQLGQRVQPALRGPQDLHAQPALHVPQGQRLQQEDGQT